MTGFIFEIYPLSPGFESRILRIIGFHGLWWMSSVWRLRLFVKDYFLPFFSPMLNASAESQEMDAPFNNNLSRPSNDVMVNPRNLVNPDSKLVAAARLISIDDWMPDGY